MLPHGIHALAEWELDEAVAHYEALSPGKGLELLGQVRAAIARICEFPDVGPIARGAVRSVLVQPTSRWHYTIYYQVEGDSIWVLAIAHQSRQPFYWLGRLPEAGATF